MPTGKYHPVPTSKKKEKKCGVAKTKRRLVPGSKVLPSLETSVKRYWRQISTKRGYFLSIRHVQIKNLELEAKGYTCALNDQKWSLVRVTKLY